MPWQETSSMLERKKFMTEWERERRLGRANFSALCRAFGITRQTGYKWLRRYLDANGDAEALRTQSRRPRSSPAATPVAIVYVLVKARKLRLHWGPRTLRAWLVRRYGPGTSLTMGTRHIADARQRRPAHSPIGSPTAGENSCASIGL